MVSIQCPTDSNPNLLTVWSRGNSIVISWILNSVSKEISASIIFSECAADIWNDLRDRFQQCNGPQNFQLRRDLASLTQNQDSVSTYFTRLKTLWEELGNYKPRCNCGQCSCGGAKSIQNYFDNVYFMYFLIGLNDSFAHIWGQLLLMDLIPSISKVFSLILQEERQRKVGALPDANISSYTLSFHVQGPHAQKGQTISPINNSHKTFLKERPYCTKCQIHGHTVDKCYKIHGYTPGYRRFNRLPSHPMTIPSPNITPQAHVNHVCVLPHNAPPTPPATTVGSFFETLNADQCQQLMTILSIQMVYSNESMSREPRENSHNTFNFRPTIVDRRFQSFDIYVKISPCFTTSMM